MTRLPGWRGRLALVALLVGGLALGATGAVVAAGTSRVGSVTVPWGVPVVLVALGVLVRGVSWWLGTRLAGLLFAVGWLLASLALATTGPGGDVLLPDDWGVRAYLIGGAALAVLALVVRLPEESAAPEPASEEPSAGR